MLKKGLKPQTEEGRENKYVDWMDHAPPSQNRLKIVLGIPHELN